MIERNEKDGADTCVICGNPLPIDRAMEGYSVCEDCEEAFGDEDEEVEEDSGVSN